MSADRPAALPSDPREHPHRSSWRLPLVALLVLGLLILAHVDRILQREYRAEAATQALQTDALLESFVKQRIALLGSVRALVATAPSGGNLRSSFARLGAEVLGDAPDVAALYLLDSTGEPVAIARRQAEPLADGAGNHFRYPNRARALLQARRSGGGASTGTLNLNGGSRGMLIYVPIARQDRVAGYVGAVLAYRSLFSDALAGQLQGRFAYRILDEAGQAIGISPAYPEHVAQRVRRVVQLPGGVQWTLEVAIRPFQPFTARVFTWIIGLLLLGLAAALVVREEARARRFAIHSHELELLSRNLLDANVRLEERSQQIAEANRAKSRFLANVSHELRTPLNAIVGYNSLALDGLYGELPSPLRIAHDRMRTAAEHLLGVVNDVLDLSKIEVGRMDVNAESLDLMTVMEGVLTVMEPIAEAKGLRMDLIVDRKAPRVTTDPRHLRQVLLNLVSNAIKFTDRGAVTLTARRAEHAPDREVWIGVEDTGIGIGEDDIERIFEEFEQVRPGGRGDSIQRGTGLGLAISRKLARLLGGDVLVSSRIGVGSRFTIILPVSGPPRATAGDGGEWGGPEHGGTARPAGGPDAAPDEAASAERGPEPTGEDSGRGARVPTDADSGEQERLSW
jgi:signal transduction histidine kinase